MKEKKKPTNYLNYTIVAWFFAFAALVFICVPLILHLINWNGYTWILFLLSGLGFACVGVAVGMVITLHCVKKDKSINDEKEYEIIKETKDGNENVNTK